MQHTARPDRITADDLRVVLDHWADLRALVDTARPRTGAEYLRSLDAHHAAEAALDRAAAAPAEREHLVLAEQPAPLRLHVVDACRAVEVALCSIADEIAAEVQRSPIAPPRRAIAGDEAALGLELLAMRDAADERRWRYNLGERTAPRAAEWLLARLHDEAGPFLPLDEAQRARIGRIARAAARRIERTVGIEQRRAYPMDDRPCPWCGATLTMHRGGSDADTVTCENGYDCRAPVPVVEGRRTWAAPHELVALEQALGKAERRRRRRDAKRAERARARAA